MSFIIVFYLLVITTINPIVNAHENHNHQIYNWSNPKDKNIETEKSSNIENSKNNKNKTQAKTKGSWTKFFRQ